jgi:predicted dehydrogenase
MPRITFLSTAHIHTKGFLKSVDELTGGSAHAIWDDVPDRGRAYAQENGCPFVEKLDAALNDPDVEGFAIMAENTRHLPLLERALPIGKPILCEKPLATSVADAARIAEVQRQHDTVLISGYFQPFSPANRGVKKLLADGTLGRVTHASFRNAHNAAYGRWFDSPELAWFAEPELSGGGALLDMGTHAVHLLRHLFGPVEKVWATCANYAGAYPKVDDYGLIVMRFASGVLGRVEAGWVFTGGHGGLEIIGSEQSVWDGAGLVVGTRKAEPAPVPAGDARPDRIARLIATIHNELPADELADDLAACLDAVCIMAAAYQSAESGTWVEVDRV